MIRSPAEGDVKNIRSRSTGSFARATTLPPGSLRVAEVLFVAGGCMKWMSEGFFIRFQLKEIFALASVRPLAMQ